jgi:hypothetical protein
VSGATGKKGRKKGRNKERKKWEGGNLSTDFGQGLNLNPTHPI